MFGDRLKELREDKGMRQEELAEMLNVTRATISAYETNTAFPSFLILVKIADIFEVSLDYLACRTKEPFNISMQNKLTRDVVTAVITTINKYKK